MSSIYIHIPFCKQACHYCDFYFSTVLKKKDALIVCLLNELKLRKHELLNQTIQTIYFGGGSPSLLSIEELRLLIEEVYTSYKVSNNPEITLEANPDDLLPHLNNNKTVFSDLKSIGINRLSIGVQSFFDSDLKFMNRLHDAKQAMQCIQMATNYFENISIDLIYGVQSASDNQWLQNIDTALSFDIPHISGYALTVEPKTALANFIKKGITKDVDEDQAKAQFYLIKEKLESKEFIHYEISNFSKEKYFSKNNLIYWQGKPYLGIGPSAHSFNGLQRSWNIRNNTRYIKEISQGNLPLRVENLSKTDRYNEYIMTGLRTMWGVSLNKIEQNFGKSYKSYLIKQAKNYMDQHLLYIDSGNLYLSTKGQFIADGITSQLFMINVTSK